MQCLQLALGMPESQAKKLESSLGLSAGFDSNQIKAAKLQLTEQDETLITSNHEGSSKLLLFKTLLTS